jgi:hypothetical protein
MGLAWPRLRGSLARQAGTFPGSLRQGSASGLGWAGLGWGSGGLGWGGLGSGGLGSGGLGSGSGWLGWGSADVQRQLGQSRGLPTASKLPHPSLKGAAFGGFKTADLGFCVLNVPDSHPCERDVAVSLHS